MIEYRGIHFYLWNLIKLMRFSCCTSIWQKVYVCFHFKSTDWDWLSSLKYTLRSALNGTTAFPYGDPRITWSFLYVLYIFMFLTFIVVERHYVTVWDRTGLKLRGKFNIRRVENDGYANDTHNENYQNSLDTIFKKWAHSGFQPLAKLFDESSFWRLFPFWMLWMGPQQS